MIKKILLFILVCLLIMGIVYHKMFIRLYQGYQGKQSGIERAKYYELQEGLQIQDITQKIISDNTIPQELKDPFVKGERHLVIFKYLSGVNQIAGYFSYLTAGEHPLIIFLRGGSGYYGITRPNNRFSLLTGYNVVGTLYRGNVYGGEDQFGGEDMQIENLMKYFPQLEVFTHKKLEPPFTMIGASRGAIEMFVALSRLDYVKQRVNRAISISGNLDLNISQNNRPEMRYLFKQQFKKSSAKNFAEWLNTRDPVYNAKYLPKTLRVLLIYGLSDNRVPLEEQKSFQHALEKQGISVQLVTIPEGDHGLSQHFPELEKTVVRFLQQ